jgi:hypothetical protein
METIKLKHKKEQFCEPEDEESFKIRIKAIFDHNL